MWRKFVFFVLVLLFSLSSLTVNAESTESTSESIAEMQERHGAIRADLGEARGELRVTQQDIDQLTIEMMRIEERLEEATNRLYETAQLLAEAEDDLAEAEIALEEAQIELDKQFERFKTRLRVMYVQGPMGYLQVVLQATSFSDFLTRLDDMNRIARSDRDIVTRMQAAEKVLTERREDVFRLVTRIEAQQVLHTRRYEYLEDVQNQQRQFMFQLQYSAVQFEALVLQLERDYREMEGIIRQAQEEARRREQAARMAANRARANVTPTGGSMNWPLPGHFHVSSPWGPRINPISRRHETHSGIDLPAPNGTPIYAAESGVVVLSGRHGGFGNTVVIEHAGGYTTLYAHNSRNLVSVGDFVSRGDRIALAGSTGFSTGPHLHFEVRINGRHVNPNPYLGI